MKKKKAAKTVETPAMKVNKRRDTRQQLISVQTMLRIQNLTVEQIKEMENHVVELRDRLKAHAHELNLEEVASRREFLEKNVGMMELFKTIWMIFQIDTEDGVLTRDGYEKFHRAILVSLMGVHSFEDVSDMIESDWQHDHSVYGPLNQLAFFDLLFETIETYTEVMDPTYYAAFTWSLLDSIADLSLVPPRLRPLREMKTITKLTHEASMIKEYLLTKKVRAALAIETEFLSRIPEVQKRLLGRRHAVPDTDRDMITAFTNSLSLQQDENGVTLGGVFSDSGEDGGVSLDSHSTLGGEKDPCPVTHDHMDKEHNPVEDDIQVENSGDDGRRKSSFLEYMTDHSHHRHSHSHSHSHRHAKGQLSPLSPIAAALPSSPSRDPDPLLLPMSDSFDNHSGSDRHSQGNSQSRARFASYLLKGSGLDRQHHSRNHMSRDKQALGEGGLDHGHWALTGSPLVMHPRPGHDNAGDNSNDEMSVLSEGSGLSYGHNKGMGLGMVHKGLYYLDYSHHIDTSNRGQKGALTMNGQGVGKSSKKSGMPLAQVMAGQFSVAAIQHNPQDNSSSPTAGGSGSGVRQVRVVHLPLAAASDNPNMREKDHWDYHHHVTNHHTHTANYNDDQASVITGNGAIITLPYATAATGHTAAKIIEPSYHNSKQASFHDPLSSQRVNAVLRSQTTREYIAARSDRLLSKMNSMQEEDQAVDNGYRQPPVDYLKQASTSSTSSSSSSVKGRFGGLLPSRRELAKMQPPPESNNRNYHNNMASMLTIDGSKFKAPTKDTAHGGKLSKQQKRQGLEEVDAAAGVMDDSTLLSSPAAAAGPPAGIIAVSLHHNHRAGSPSSRSMSPSRSPPSRQALQQEDKQDILQAEQHDEEEVEEEKQEYYCMQSSGGGGEGSVSAPLIKPIPFASRGHHHGKRAAVPRAIHMTGLSSSMSLSTTDFPPLTNMNTAFKSSGGKVPWLPRGTLTPLDNPDHSDLVTGWREKIELLRLFPFDASRDRMRIMLSNRDSRKAFEQFAARHHEYYMQQQQAAAYDSNK